MMLESIASYAIAACLLIGAAFSLIGSIGLLKFNDSMTRLHAPTKVGTMGIGGLLLASIIHTIMFGNGALHDLLIMGFLFLTAPISGNFLSKVNIHKRTCMPPPPPTRDTTWAVLDVPEEDLALGPDARP